MSWCAQSFLAQHPCSLTLRQSTTETPSHDVPSEQPQLLVDGVADKDGSTPDGEPTGSGAISAEISVNGGSDTEASKTETAKVDGEEKGHGRTASTVKKPTSFKPVSVNKKFLATKGPAPAALLKAGDAVPGTTTAQPGASASATLRPRLVAKTGNSLRDSAPRTSASANGGKAGAAPDASAVWNKNRRMFYFSGNTYLSD